MPSGLCDAVLPSPQSKLQDELSSILSPRGIVVESVLLKGVVLPDMLKESIEKKAQAGRSIA